MKTNLYWGYAGSPEWRSKINWNNIFVCVYKKRSLSTEIGDASHALIHVNGKLWKDEINENAFNTRKAVGLRTTILFMCRGVRSYFLFSFAPHDITAVFFGQFRFKLDIYLFLVHFMSHMSSSQCIREVRLLCTQMCRSSLLYFL